MKRAVGLLGLAIFLIIILTGVVVFAQKEGTTAPQTTQKPVEVPSIQQKCCIAGIYNGTNKDITCPPPRKPETGKFIMDIQQDKACGSKIWGKITDLKGGPTMNFTGTITLGKGGCCNIQGMAENPNKKESVKFKGVLCRKGGKWTGNGDYTHSNGCTGKWEMTQS
jgi:hypothetical protein